LTLIARVDTVKGCDCELPEAERKIEDGQLRIARPEVGRREAKAGRRERLLRYPATGFEGQTIAADAEDGRFQTTPIVAADNNVLDDQTPTRRRRS